MTTSTLGHERTGWRFFGYLARRAIMMEIRGYQSIYRFLFRRPKVPSGAVGFSYYQPILPILIVFEVTHGHCAEQATKGQCRRGW
jgi:hypothetical protein